jgi:uncharacterized protein (DUF1501 family)
MHRRQFIKQSAGMVSVGLVMPNLLLGARGATGASGASASSGRRIFVVIQLAGGNDGLNTVIPYTDSNYHKMRPTISFKDSELKDAAGNSTIVSDQFGFHPALAELKALYDAGRVAVALGVGYPNPTLSHFLSMDIWHTANLGGVGTEGWLGKYADLELAGKPGLPATAVGGVLPKTLFSNDVVIPSIINFQVYDFLTDPAFAGDSKNQLSTFEQIAGRDLPAGSLDAAASTTGLNAVQDALKVKAAIANYSSQVVYPADNPLAQGLQMLAQIITTIPEVSLLYVTLGSFDHHSDQISHPSGTPNKLAGQHAQLLGWFSQAVRLFYDDLAQHSLADNVVIMQWSEFGRRVNENASFGTDHGTAAPLFVIGNPVAGGLYGKQPLLDPLSLDSAGNMVFTTDFRSVYSTILDKWLGVDSNQVLGLRFSDVGFLG